MWTALPSRLNPGRLLLWSAPLAWLGCGGGGTDVVLPSLSITTSTAGVELDPDGYSIVVDGGPGQSIGLDATLIVDQLQDGQHTLELSGLASNCATTGENPRMVSVRSGATASVAFAVTCSATSGTIEVATATSGPGSDPDGYALLLDGSDRGPIAASATASLNGVSPGPHLLGLTGLAANCQVVGENPRSITVASGQTAQVPFAVTCAAPEPTAGTIEITTSTSGSDQDADGYRVAVDGGTGQPIGPNATVTLANVSASEHTVQLLDVAANCSVAGTNPARAAVPSGGVARIAFAVSCTPRPAGTGSVQITVATAGSSLDPDGYTVSVDGGSAQAITINGSRTVGSLTVGSHSVRLAGLAGNCTVSGDNPRSVTIAAGQTATVRFDISCAATGPSINLRIEGMYLTQSTQRLRGDVPVIQGRDGYLRVFVTASSTNSSARPSVRVRFFRNGAPAGVETIAAPGSPPVSVQEGSLGTSWNLRVPASLIQPGLAILADVDPTGSVAETNEGDNSFPSSGTAQVLTVRSVPAATIRFVPVLQSANGLQGNVGNINQLIDLTRRMYPLGSVQAEVRAVYTTSGRALDPQNADSGWGRILGEIDALRVAEGLGGTYYGVVKLDYSFGMIGNAYLGEPTAIGTDAPSHIARVLAHELGHTWGRWHSACGGPPPNTLDPSYPYPGGQIGAYGLDMASTDLKAPTTPDIMGYCLNPWISDYTYRDVMAFRQANPVAAGIADLQQPSVLIWGYIVNGRAVLEPAFEIVTRPSLPVRPGPYSVEAVAVDGTRLFSLSFDATPMADDPHGSRHFAFAVPLDPARAGQLGTLRLTAPGGQMAARSLSVAQLRRTGAADSIVVQRDAGGVAVKWNPATHPMVMVRDPDTGEVLSFARGGNARVSTAKGEVDLQVSDGVRSHRLRRAISRP
jgi:hypothetical protein